VLLVTRVLAALVGLPAVAIRRTERNVHVASSQLARTGGVPHHLPSLAVQHHLSFLADLFAGYGASSRVYFVVFGHIQRSIIATYRGVAVNAVVSA